MKPDLINYLQCNQCSSDFLIKENEKIKDEIINGSLICKHCRVEVPISRSIPRFVNLKTIETKATAKAFGYEWKKFRKITDYYENQFLEWIFPVKPSFFKNKVVLDAGCGKGRHIIQSAKFGAKKIIGIDIGEAIDVAYENTKEFDNVHLIQADIHNPPLMGSSLDYIYSVGVIHHINSPEIAVSKLANLLSNGGHLSLWLYGAENNEWIVKFINPIRIHLTSKMSPDNLKDLCYAFGLLLHTYCKFFYKSILTNWLSDKLFYADYMKNISDFSYIENVSILFDHLIAPTARYYSNNKAKELAARDGLKLLEINWCHKNSWSLFLLK